MAQLQGIFVFFRGCWFGFNGAPEEETTWPWFYIWFGNKKK